ncbi:MAG: aminotransferase class I/II-fold pyridoxal phosphate-dependent enzyme, partial [Acidobacteriota bacterium]|nr:aminotransferase class I/II-fold pyridoxal phosphate-dependent enzyme [Acidobacteriota bacterium]
MFDSFRAGFRAELESIREAGTFKHERVISSPQSASIDVPQGEVLNFCANNYLGLADDPDIIAMAKQALDDRGFGMASVRFICGTLDLHRTLEHEIAEFIGTDDAITFAA